MIDYDEDVHNSLAQQVADLYIANPTLTINLVASHLDTTIQDVTLVLDSFKVVGGVPIYCGPGGGGGWIEESERIKLVSGFDAPVLEHEDLGNRWPDGSLRDEPFDILNAEHRAEFGVSLEQPAT